MRQIATKQKEKRREEMSILSDSDVIAARQRGRALAQRIGFDGTDVTLVATLISEMARMFVRRALPGTISVAATEEAGNVGITVVASIRFEKNALEPELPHLPPLLEPELLSRVFPSINGIKVCSKPHETILTMMKQNNGNLAPASRMMSAGP